MVTQSTKQTRRDAAEASQEQGQGITTKLLNTIETAHELGISKRSLQEHMAARKIGFCKFGRNIRFAREDISRFIESHRVLPVGWKGGKA